MTWEAITAVGAILTVLVMIIQRLDKQNQIHAERIRKETEEKSAMEHRVRNLETQFTSLNERLIDNTKQIWRAIDALRIDMPRSIGQAIAENMRESGNR